jgi:hypothetical protein
VGIMQGFLKTTLDHISFGFLGRTKIDEIFMKYGVNAYVGRRSHRIIDKSHLEDVKREVKSINEKYWDDDRAKNINFVKYTLERVYAKKVLEKEKGVERDGVD